VNKKPLIGVSILAVVLLVLSSLSNVVGYQTQYAEDEIGAERGSLVLVAVSNSEYDFPMICF